MKTYEEVLQSHNYRSLEYYAKNLENYANIPPKLADLLIEMTSDYGSVSDMLIPIKQEETKYWLKMKESDKKLSNNTIQMMWSAEEGGALQFRMDMYQKGLDKMMSNLKAILYEKRKEAENSF